MTYFSIPDYKKLNKQREKGLKLGQFRMQMSYIRITYLMFIYGYIKKPTFFIIINRKCKFTFQRMYCVHYHKLNVKILLYFNFFYIITNFGILLCVKICTDSKLTILMHVLKFFEHSCICYFIFKNVFYLPFEFMHSILSITSSTLAVKLFLSHM